MRLKVLAGFIKLTISFSSIFLAIYNINNMLVLSDSLIINFIYWLPLFIISIGVWFVRLEKTMFCIALYAGVMLTGFTSSVYDITGIVFFLLALNIKNDKKSLLYVSINTIISIFVRTQEIDLSILQIFLILLAYFGSYLLFYTPKLLKRLKWK